MSNVAVSLLLVTLVAGACDSSSPSDPDPVVCGDGVTDSEAGEECDDGNADVDDACVDCRSARCGDGFVQHDVETCDDGNADDEDRCVDCRPARCGDGVIRAGVEECEDPGGVGCTIACLSCATDGEGVAYAVSLDGHCYKLTTALLDQPAAKASCEAINGHLVSITDESQRLELSMNLINTTSWIGLIERISDGGKEWITGEAFGAFAAVAETMSTNRASSSSLAG